MKKYVIATTLLSLLTAAPAMAACTYALDATNSQISSAGAQPFTIKIDQRVRSPITASTGAVHYMASSQAMLGSFLSGSLVGDKTLPTTGVVAMEYRVPYFPSTKPVNNGELDSNIILLSQDTTDQVMLAASLYVHSGYNGVAAYPESARVGGYIAGGSYTVVNGSSQPNQPTTFLPTIAQTLPLSTNFRIGIYLNQDSKQLGLIVNGVNQGYVFTYDKPLKNIGFIIGSTRAKIDATDPVVGSYAGGALITDAADMAYSYPSGAKDMCGNTI